MGNQHLFELMNAPPGVGALQLALATLLARWVICVVPLAIVIAWVRGDHASRRQLLHLLLAAAIAIAVAEAVSLAWPQPRPGDLNLCTQYLDAGAGTGLPSAPVTLLWSLALAALTTRRYALWGLPVLALGLLVGWSRVHLGANFPLDILAALPAAVVGTIASGALRTRLQPVSARVLVLYDRLLRWLGVPPQAAPAAPADRHRT